MLSRIFCCLLMLPIAGCLVVDDLGIGNGNTPPAEAERSPSLSTGIAANGIILQDAYGFLQVDLMVVGRVDGQPATIGGVLNPTVSLGDLTFPLVTTQQTGHFTTNSALAPALIYQAGATYVFAFEMLYRTGETDAFEAMVQAPTANPRVSWADQLINFAGESIEVDVGGLVDGGILRLRDAQGVPIYSTFNFTSPLESDAALDSILAVTGPIETIPGAAVTIAGDYAVEAFTIAVSDVNDSASAFSPNLVDGSWAIAGRAQAIALPVETF